MAPTNPDDSLKLRLKKLPPADIKALEKVAATFAKDLASNKPRGEVLARAGALKVKLTSLTKEENERLSRELGVHLGATAASIDQALIPKKIKSKVTSIVTTTVTTIITTKVVGKLSSASVDDDGGEE